MYGYKVSLKGLPETLFACSTTVDNYSWQNANDKNTIEISISKAESSVVVINGESYNFQNGANLSCVIGDEERCAYCQSGVQNEITSVAVRFEELLSSGCELSEKDAKDNTYFLLPAFLEDAFQVQEITRLLNKYINNYTSGTSYDKALCMSIWFEMLSLIDRHTREFLCIQTNRSDNYYIKKIDYIIKNRYSEKLSLTKIAEEFGVSMSYLSSTYSSKSHRSFKEALLSTRMKNAKELILTTAHSLDEVADMVGLCDGTYLRKCFKKFYGVSISEFKKINKGLTLYHDKPVRK